MPQKLKDLGPEHWKLLADTRQQWEVVSRSTGPTDLAAAKETIGDAYQAAGLDPPRQWVHLESPLHGILAATLYARGLEPGYAGALGPGSKLLPDSVYRAYREIAPPEQPRQQKIVRQVTRGLRRRAWRAVRGDTTPFVRALVRGGRAGSLPADYPNALATWPLRRDAAGYDRLYILRTLVSDIARELLSSGVPSRPDSMAGSHCDVTADAVKVALYHDLRNPIESMMVARQRSTTTLFIAFMEMWNEDVCHGSLDASWLAFYDFFRQVGVGQIEFLEPVMRAAVTCGWWWPFETLCVVTDRPSALCLDNEGKMHSADQGPALDYNGAWSLWDWHGIRVSQRFIEMSPEVRAVLDERNAEVRRERLERIGIERFFQEVDAAVRHQDIDGHSNPRRLLAIQLSNDDPDLEDPDATIVVVQVVDPSTGRQYFLRVPPNIYTCQEAVAWTFGFRWNPDGRYKPKVET